jgi:hypothetical protein
LVEADEVAEARSFISASVTDSPRPAASRAMPQPLMPAADDETGSPRASASARIPSRLARLTSGGSPLSRSLPPSATISAST